MKDTRAKQIFTTTELFFFDELRSIWNLEPMYRISSTCVYRGRLNAYYRSAIYVNNLLESILGLRGSVTVGVDYFLSGYRRLSIIRHLNNML